MASNTDEPAPETSAVEKPRDWEKAIDAARLRMAGLTQKDAAEAAGIGERTLRVYESCKWWPTAMEEARKGWLQGVQLQAMGGIAKALDDPNEYAKMARWLAERLMPELAPPKQGHEHTGKDGGPILLGRSDIEDIREILAQRLTAGSESGAGSGDPEQS